MRLITWFFTCFLFGCAGQSEEQAYLRDFPDELRSFAGHSIDDAIARHRRLIESAHTLEANGAFREMNADRTIGYLALRLYALETAKGNAAAATRYKDESMRRLIAGEIIPGTWTSEKKEELWRRELEQLFKMENPQWRQ
jgi:hypothetical protein